jgi:hypothetical protein
MRRIAALVIGVSLAFPTAALGSLAGQYIGTTSQNLGHRRATIELDVGAKNTVGLVTYEADYTGGPVCKSADGSVQQFNRRLRIKHNKFSATVILQVSDVVKITGRFRGRTVSGSFIETYDPGIKGLTCTSGKVMYTASRR